MGSLSKKKRSVFYGYLFFFPFAVIFIIFKLIPFFQSIWLTFNKWDVFGPPVFVGLANFKALFTSPNFWSSLWHTTYFTLLTVPPLVIFGFFMAILVNSYIHFKGVFRSVFFLPFIFSISVIMLTWGLLYNSSYGLFNIIIKSLGLKPVQWLNDPDMAMISIALTTIWWTVGFNFIIYLSGLQQISPSYYEASDIDGASAFQKLIYITFPLLKRSHIIVIILQVIASLQIFGQVYIMTGGGPGGKTRVLVQYIYEQGFRYFKMGYAQAVAFVFFILMIFISYLQMKLMTRKEEQL
ncbi:MAG: sugar ABC transporter permease [Nitrospirae bacterium]|nr:sugar ABC transporter permease [Nitrospirota bacterium]